MAIFLGIDIGTSSTKTLAMDGNGCILGQATSSYSSIHLKPTWSEQDPEEWWQATIQSVHSVMKQTGAKPGDVKAIGLSGQMHGAVFLDSADKVIRKAILWNDQRTTSECHEMENVCGGRLNLVKLTANRAITGFTAP